MKSLLLTCCLFLLTALSLRAQGFYISDMDVNLKLRRDGMLEVEEVITVQFEESKHGIIRDIPYKYLVTSMEGEVAEGRGAAGSEYQLWIGNVDVAGEEFDVLREGAFCKIKIGSASEYVSGEHVYRIRYDVFGAVNRFSQLDELPWNLTGNSWPCRIEGGHYRMELPPGYKPAADPAWISYTGITGAIENNAWFERKGNVIEGGLRKPLNASEGVTLAVNMAKGVIDAKNPPLQELAQDYLVERINTDLLVTEEGEIIGEEIVEIELKNSSMQLARWWGDVYPLRWPPETQSLRPQLLYDVYQVDSWTAEGGFKACRFENTRTEGQKTLIYPQIAFAPGKHVFRIRYRLYGNNLIENAQPYLFLDPVGTAWPEPVRDAKIRIHLPPGARAGMPAPFTRMPYSLKTSADTLVELTTAGPFTQGDGLPIVIPYKAGTIAWRYAPARLTCNSWHLRKLDAEYIIESDGTIRVRQTLDLGWDAAPPYSLETHVPRCLSHEWDTTWVSRRPHPFGTYSYLLVNDFITNTEYLDFSSSRRISLMYNIPFSLENKHHRLEQSWSVYGLLSREGEGYRLKMPLWEGVEEPGDTLLIRLVLANGTAWNTQQLRLLSNIEALSMHDYSIQAKGNTVIIGVHRPLMAGEGVNLDAVIPAAAVPATSWGKEFRLWYANNPWTILSCFAGLLTFVLWWFKGRDKTGTIMPEFYPPAGMTSAEAGLLYDDHIHHRDLLSLIFDWGAHGLLRMEEINTGQTIDYKLTKLKGLPKDAKKFEKTLWEALFDNRSVVTLSSLRYTFYHHITKAKGELEKEAVKGNWFVKGSRGWGTVVFLLGVGMLILSVIGLACTVFQMYSEWTHRFDFSLSTGLLGVLMVGFGMNMGKKTGQVKRTYEHLLGFRMFLEKAERDRLETLMQTDPTYFEKTLSFAIALGMATQWMQRFKDLELPAPTYYSSSSQDTRFDLNEFQRRLHLGLNNMSHNLNSTPPSSGGSGGGGYSGGSSGGSSYSSYSGSGGSFSGGGGYSGGGYGGGGGSSW